MFVLQKQEASIKEKTEFVMADLAQVKPAVEDARQGKFFCFICLQ